MQSAPLVTILIPYYNYGHLIQETIDSLLPIVDLAIHEVIIINDGSTEQSSIDKIKEIEKTTPYQVVHQENMGLGQTRNNGIKLAKGKYFLPLDADNLLTDLYLKEGVQFLEQNLDYTAVYGRSKLFDEETGFLKTREISLQSLSLANYVDACAIFRKQDLIAAGGYDTKMPKQGFEDWELWIRLFTQGRKLHYISKGIAQHYRVRNTSMARSYSKSETDANYTYLQNKFPAFLDYDALDIFYYSKFEAAPIGWIAKLFIRKFFPTWYTKLVKKGTFRKHL